ncbi:class I SAM-dependent methyltransferase [Oscillospiraceae bacterium OttesenSCG-928-G22]|nr:class I SAM-dependent methyltransferase [Oscillospiraceae bacterium OttesenSCG-928-G22]
MAYKSLARVYDALTWDVPYVRMVEFAVSRFKRAAIPVKGVLDLACGTGSASLRFAEIGYAVVSTDRSADMLSVARMKADECENPPLFLLQPMEKLDLYARVDATCCFLDSLNYVRDEKTLSEIFRRVHLFLNPGGVFVFDVHAPGTLEERAGSAFADERDGVFCVWRASETERKGEFSLLVDLFFEEGERYRRHTEEHFEYAHDPDMLQTLLTENGFTDIDITGAYTGHPATDADSRLCFTASRPM